MPRYAVDPKTGEPTSELPRKALAQFRATIGFKPPIHRHILYSKSSFFRNTRRSLKQFIFIIPALELRFYQIPLRSLNNMEASTAQRRNGTQTPKTAESSTASASDPQTTRSPLLPTPLEALLLAIYPSTLLLGSVFSLLEPHARAAPYSAESQSHPSHLAPSYFALKRNVFNVYFVKIGWFWTSLAFTMFLFLHPSTGPNGGLILNKKRVQGLLRWALMTVWWAALTQWFFGPPLIDRGFSYTGGQCELLRTAEGRDRMSDGREYFTAAACKLAGGKWKGGHDISGHVFLLVLGSGFLWMEILPAIAGREMRTVKRKEGAVITADREAEGEKEREDKEARQGLSVPLIVAGLSWWMLLMTAAYFHTWFEKVCPAPCKSRTMADQIAVHGPGRCFCCNR